MNFLTLSELSYLIKSAIHSTLIDEYRVIAEIAQINYHVNSGHCYLDLVEKQDVVIAAKIRANIWAKNCRLISSNFRKLTGRELQAGMKILALVKITYHEVHGLSLNIRDIDPSYTLGEMALKRRQVIEQLTKEGIIDLNRKIPLPPVLQRIAVISSPGAAGYGDFLSRLENNPYGYAFSHKLFHALVQGDKAEESIRNALRSCMKSKGAFDAVVIIRGGGSTVDLHCFDGYALAKEIALSPVPVLTGIGHERDETVADSVAHMRLITPTAVAEFLISKARQFEDGIDDLRRRLVLRTNTLIAAEKHLLENISSNLSGHCGDYLRLTFNSLKHDIFALHSSAFAAMKTPFAYLKTCEGSLTNAGERLLFSKGNALKEYSQTLLVLPDHLIAMCRKGVENAEAKIRLLDPVNILKRGYSITFFEGKVLKESNTVNKTDIIFTRLSSGTVTSIVEGIQPEENRE